MLNSIVHLNVGLDNNNITYLAKFNMKNIMYFSMHDMNEALKTIIVLQIKMLYIFYLQMFWEIALLVMGNQNRCHLKMPKIFLIWLDCVRKKEVLFSAAAAPLSAPDLNETELGPNKCQQTATNVLKCRQMLTDVALCQFCISFTQPLHWQLKVKIFIMPM